MTRVKLAKNHSLYGPDRVGGRAGGQPKLTGMDEEAEDVLYDGQIRQLRIRGPNIWSAPLPHWE